MIGDTATRVLLAVTWNPRPTIPALAAELGLSRSTVHGHLTTLRDEGLVTWEDGKAGTLRSNVRLIVPNSRSGYNNSGSQHRGNGTGPLDTTAPSKRRDHARD